MNAYYASAFYAKVRQIMAAEQITEGAAIRRVVETDPALHEKALERHNGDDSPLTDAELVAKYKGAAPPLDRLAEYCRHKAPGISEGESYRQACRMIAGYDKKYK